MDIITDYWLNWRRAYHTGVESYHREMSGFYTNQMRINEEYVKNIIRTYETFCNLFMQKFLEQSVRMGMFGR